METNVLKKRLNTFKSSSGKMRNISDDVIINVLRAWENWTGTTADLYRELGISKMQMAIILKKAKKLIKSGIITDSEFQQINVEPSESSASRSHCSIEVDWVNGQVIRFGDVDLLLDFLKKAA